MYYRIDIRITKKFCLAIPLKKIKQIIWSLRKLTKNVHFLYPTYVIWA